MNFTELINLLNGNIAENEKRMSAIEKELGTIADESVLKERKAEIETLKANNAENVKQREALIKQREELAQRSFAGSTKIEPQKTGKTTAERNKDFRDKLVARSASFQTRSILATQSPFKVGAEGINGVHTAAPALVDYVDVKERIGENNERIGYDTGDTEMAAHTSGSAVNTSDLSGAYVEVPGYQVATIIKVDRAVWDNPNVDQEAYVNEKMQQAFRKTVGGLITNGVASKFYGLANAVDQAGTSMVATANLNAIDADSLTSIVIGATGNADEIPGAGLLILNKKDLVKFSKIRGTGEKKRVYEFTPDANDTNTGILSEGGIAVRYIISSKVPESTMYYGKGLGYRLNIYSDLRLETSTEAFFSTDEVAIKGVATVGGNVQDKFAFAKITVGSATANS